MSNRNFINDNDVISVNESDKICINHKTFTLQEFLMAFFSKFFSSDVGKKWMFEGVECRLLSPGKGWQKGKVKISLEFIADEVESPLEEIRQMGQEIN